MNRRHAFVLCYVAVRVYNNILDGLRSLAFNERCACYICLLYGSYSLVKLDGGLKRRVYPIDALFIYITYIYIYRVLYLRNAVND